MAEEMLKAYRCLGKSGLKVSPLCLGAMTFGDHFGLPGQCNEELSHQLLDKFAELGGNFIDTANRYAVGESERIIGTWLKKQDRQKFVIATKVYHTMDPKNPNSGGLSRKSIIWSVDESLKRLQTDYIDLLQIHNTDVNTPLDETLRTMDDLIRAGKIRYVGSSNAYAHELQKIVDTTQFLGLNRWISLQMQYNLLERTLETEHVMVCKNEGLGILPWSPLKGGWLTGKMKRGQTPGGDSRVGAMEKTAFKDFMGYSKIASRDWVWKLLDRMKEIANDTGKTVAQIAIRWLLQKEAVTSVIIGCKNMAQLEANMGAIGWELSSGQMADLDKLSAPTQTETYLIMQIVHSGALDSHQELKSE